MATAIDEKQKQTFYTYVYLDYRKPGCYSYGRFKFDYEPFYVGKGSKEQYLAHLSEARLNFKSGNQVKLNKIRKIQRVTGCDPIIIKFKDNQTEDEAYDLEKIMVDIIGRTDLGKGPLTNLINGGIGGPSGYIFTEDQLKHKSKIMKEICSTPEWKEKNRQAQLIAQNRPDVIEQRRASRLEFYKNPENRKKLSEGVKKAMTAEYRDNMSRLVKKRYEDPREREKASEIQKEVQNRPEVKAAIAASTKKMWRNPVIRKTITEKMKGNDYNAATWKIITPSGEIIIQKSLLNFCKENNLDYTGLNRTQKGKTYKGYSCRKVTSNG